MPLLLIDHLPLLRFFFSSFRLEWTKSRLAACFLRICSTRVGVKSLNHGASLNIDRKFADIFPLLTCVYPRFNWNFQEDGLIISICDKAHIRHCP